MNGKGEEITVDFSEMEKSLITLYFGIKIFECFMPKMSLRQMCERKL